jgi:hypothetical protein
LKISDKCIRIYVLCKIEVRHILFKKIVFIIFLNNPVTVHCARAYFLKRKKQKPFFSFQSMPNFNFAEGFIRINRELLYNE